MGLGISSLPLEEPCFQCRAPKSSNAKTYKIRTTNTKATTCTMKETEKTCNECKRVGTNMNMSSSTQHFSDFCFWPRVLGLGGPPDPREQRVTKPLFWKGLAHRLISRSRPITHSVWDWFHQCWNRSYMIFLIFYDEFILKLFFWLLLLTSFLKDIFNYW